MKDEIKRRKIFFGLHFLLTILFAIFIWTNDFFYPRNVNIDAKGEKAAETYSLQLPAYATAQPLPIAKASHRPVEDSIIKRLNDYRQQIHLGE